MEEQNKLVKAEPQLVTVPTKNGNERLVARAADGKFSKRQAAATKKSIRDVVAFFEGKATDPATGKPLDKTRHEAILEKIYEAMMQATGEDLVGLSKAYAELQKAAYGSKGKDRVIEQSDPENNAIKVILITTPTLPTKEQKPTPTKPSWLEAEIIETNSK